MSKLHQMILDKTPIISVQVEESRMAVEYLRSELPAMTKTAKAYKGVQFEIVHAIKDIQYQYLTNAKNNFVTIYVNPQETSKYIVHAGTLSISEDRFKILYRNKPYLGFKTISANLLGFEGDKVDTGIKQDIGLNLMPEPLLNLHKRYAEGEDVHPSTILYGEPGVGKSVSIKQLSQLGLPFVQIDLPTLLSGDLGGSEKNVSQALNQIVYGRAFVYIPEVDKIFSVGTKDKTLERVMVILMNYLDTTNHCVLLCANNIDAVPEVLIRSGRINIRHHFTGLTEQQKAELGVNKICELEEIIL